MICGSQESAQVLSVKSAPKFHVIKSDKALEENLYGVINLVACKGCGHLFNNFAEPASSQESEYFLTNTPITESMLTRHQNTVDYLSPASNKTLEVLDVGAGSGALAAAFAARGHHVTVVEPSTQIDFSSLKTYGAHIVNDTWPTATLKGRNFDLVLCVQVLEHIETPCEFLKSIVEVLKDGGKIYLEIPSGDWVVKQASIADIHFPHINYFSSKIISEIFRKVSLNLVNSRDLLNGRDIGFLLEKGSSPDSEVAVGFAASSLQRSIEQNIKSAENIFATLIKHKTFAIYGANAGSQALFGFFPKLKPEFLIDDTPAYRSTSAYSEVAKFPIFEPDRDLLQKIEAVVIASYIHDSVIASKIQALGFHGEIYSLRPANDSSGLVRSIFKN